MNRIFIVISIIAVFFCFVPVFAGGPETIDTKKVLEDLKGDRMRAEDVKSQDGQELKRFLEQEKRARSEMERSVKEGKPVRPEEIKTPPVPPEETQAPAAEENNFLDSATSVSVQRGLYFLIAICFGFMYYYRIVTYKKKLAAEKKRTFAELEDNLLAAVNQWIFMEEDFKKYQDKLTPLIDAQLLDINSPEFKKHFVKDLAVTEILFQAALNENMQADPALITSLGQYKLYLSDLEKEGSTFSNALDNYRRSLTPTAGQPVPYAAYYKDFLNLLMIVNKQDDTVVFELYQRYLLINKLAGKAGRGSADAGEIQEGMDSAINKFKSEQNVIIKEESIEPEPPKEE